MKISNKVLFIMSYVVSSTVIASSSNPSLYEKLYRLAEKIYYIEYSLNPEQQKITEELANQMDAVISYPNDVSCGNKLNVFQESYKWSYSSDGLNSTSSEAEQFATQITNKLCPAAYFKVFQLSYNFAYPSSGLNKTRNEAKNFATVISDYEAAKFYTKNSLQCFIDNYNFAYSSGGMNKTRSEAEKFATQQCLA